MASQFIPKSMAMMSSAMNDFVRNRFKLETQGSQTASPGSIVTFNLPESALLHLPSIRFFFDVATTSATQGSTTVYGKLPADASSLISKLEIFIGGVQVQNGTAEYATIARILKIAEGSLPRDQSVDRALSHGAIDSADAVDNEQLCLQEWRGFLGESATEYLPTDLCGAVTIRMTFSQPNVLVPKEAGVALGDDLSADGKIAAGNLSYTINNMYMTVDSIVPPMAYSEVLRERLSQGDIRINYKDYNSFSMAGVGSSFTHRFGVSSASLDKIYGVVRDSNYLDNGVKAVDMGTSGTGDSVVANAFRFRTYENGNNFRYNWTINNVQHPQYQARSLEALADIHYGSNKLGAKAQGSLVSSREWFKDGLGVITLQLNCPTEAGVAVRSGFNSKGINTQLTLKQSGMTTPVANAGTGETTDRNSFVVCESTQQLCIGLGKQLSIVY
jgi:hypothetical protein